ncbi:hypothetical protein HYU82_02215 [Candidatus Saccharibacteria bacterium]|nr:hypothetical protein [Candidatus Saccharibacteria bacterium]
MPKSQSEFAVRKRVEQLGDRRIVNATQFRETNTETIVGCRVTILDTNRPIPHVMVAEWSPLSINEHEFGIDEVEAALDEVA